MINKILSFYTKYFAIWVILFGVVSVFKMALARRRTLSIEIGMQNAGLGTVLALKHFQESSAIPTAIFVFICIITASIMAEVWQRRTDTQIASP